MPQIKKSQVRVGLISLDNVGSKMAGPGMRYYELSKALSKYFKVTIFVPDSTDLSAKEFSIVPFVSKNSSRDLAKKIKGQDVIIAQNLRPPLLNSIRKSGIRFIADLYDPLAIEVLEYTKDDNKKLRQSTFDFNYYSLALQLNSADHILCASDRQRDYYVGVLSGKKILEPDFYDASPSLGKFITIAPFGLRQEEPVAKNPEAFYQEFPEIKKSDKIVYWGGGIWNWFDPLSVIKAIEILSKKRNDIKLFFLGMKHPNPKIKAMKMTKTALDYATKNGLLDKFVFFNFDWTPFEERTNYLTKSAIGVSTHFDNAETRFSFRTRVLDYLWAELPMVLTTGDSFADLCQRKNLGIVVDFEKPGEIADAFEKISDNAEFTSQIKKNLSMAKKIYYWETVAKNIAEVINGEKYLQRKFKLVNFLNLTFDFYKAGLKKKLTK
jgi:glycosyltransferase involved in cell wall biosynthesis